MKTAIMLAIIVLSGALGDVFIAKGLKQVGEIATLRPRELVLVGKKIIGNVSLLIGMLCMVAGFFAFLAVLSWADLSFIIPATSLSFVIATLGAKWILKESIDRLRWLGIWLVGLGMAFISLP